MPKSRRQVKKPRINERKRKASVSIGVELPEASAIERAESRWGTKMGRPTIGAEAMPEVLTLRVPAGTTDRLAELARARGVKVADFVREILAKEIS